MLKNSVLTISIFGAQSSVFAGEPADDYKMIEEIRGRLDSIRPGYSLREMEAVGVFTDAEKAQIKSIREINGKLVHILSSSSRKELEWEKQMVDPAFEVHRLAADAQDKMDRIRLKGEIRVENSKEFQEAIFKNRAAAGVREATYSFIRGLSKVPASTLEAVGSQIRGEQSFKNYKNKFNKPGALNQHEEIQPKDLINTD